MDGELEEGELVDEEEIVNGKPSSLCVTSSNFDPNSYNDHRGGNSLVHTFPLLEEQFFCRRSGHGLRKENDNNRIVSIIPSRPLDKLHLFYARGKDIATIPKYLPHHPLVINANTKFRAHQEVRNSKFPSSYKVHDRASISYMGNREGYRTISIKERLCDRYPSQNFRTREIQEAEKRAQKTNLNQIDQRTPKNRKPYVKNRVDMLSNNRKISTNAAKKSNKQGNTKIKFGPPPVQTPWTKKSKTVTNSDNQDMTISLLNSAEKQEACVRKVSMISKYKNSSSTKTKICKPSSDMSSPAENISSSIRNYDDKKKSLNRKILSNPYIKSRKCNIDIPKKFISKMTIAPLGENSSLDDYENTLLPIKKEKTDTVVNGNIEKIGSIPLPPDFEASLEALLKCAREKVNNNKKIDNVIGVKTPEYMDQTENVRYAEVKKDFNSSGKKLDMIYEEENKDLYSSEENYKQETELPRNGNEELCPNEAKSILDLKLQLVAEEKKLIAARSIAKGMFASLHLSMDNYKKKKEDLDKTAVEVKRLSTYLENAINKLRIANESMKMHSRDVASNHKTYLEVKNKYTDLKRTCSIKGEELSGSAYEIPSKGSSELESVIKELLQHRFC